MTRNHAQFYGINTDSGRAVAMRQMKCDNSGYGFELRGGAAQWAGKTNELCCGATSGACGMGIDLS